MNERRQWFTCPESRSPLDTAEGILIAMRHCVAMEAFDELVDAAFRYRVGLFSLASGLVAVATGADEPAGDPRAYRAADREWGGLFGA